MTDFGPSLYMERVRHLLIYRLPSKLMLNQWTPTAPLQNITQKPTRKGQSSQGNQKQQSSYLQVKGWDTGNESVPILLLIRDAQECVLNCVCFFPGCK